MHANGQAPSFGLTSKTICCILCHRPVVPQSWQQNHRINVKTAGRACVPRHMTGAPCFRIRGNQHGDTKHDATTNILMLKVLERKT